jgi:hypothetical protein
LDLLTIDVVILEKILMMVLEEILVLSLTF